MFYVGDICEITTILNKFIHWKCVKDVSQNVKHKSIDSGLILGMTMFCEWQIWLKALHMCDTIKGNE